MLLLASNVHKHFDTDNGQLQVLRGVDLKIEAGEKTAITGESGCGKSTLLHLLAGLETIDQGEVIIDGISLAGLGDKGRANLRRHTVGVIFQQFNLIPSLNVIDNLRFHARLSGVEDTSWNGQLANRLGLQDMLTRYPEQLSGGQQQRVAVARTLAARPKLVLADEPTGNLDQDTSDVVIDLIVQLIAETDAALLLVTHSEHLAGRMDRHLHMEKGRVFCA